MKTWNDFHNATTADFEPCDRPADTPDYVSASGSRYWQVVGGVVRQADHWGVGIRSCNWFFGGEQVAGRLVCGYCRFEDFRADAEAVPAYQAHWSRVMTNLAAAEAERQRIAALQTPGTRVRVVRRVIERLAARRFAERIEEVTFIVAKRTANFIVSADGRRYGLGPIQEWAAA